MDSYEKILAIGGKKNSLGRAQEVVDDVYTHPEKLSELFGCIFADDAWIRMRAIDSFEKIVKEKPEWAQPYLDMIFDDLTASDQASIQWHLAQIFSEVELTDEQRERAIAWLKNKIKTVDVDWIVSVNAMKALLYFYQGGFTGAKELDQLFETQEGHKSPSVRKKASAFRQELSATVGQASH